MLFFGTATEDLFDASRKLESITADYSKARINLLTLTDEMYKSDSITAGQFVQLKEGVRGFLRPQVLAESLHQSMESRSIEHKQTSKLKRIIAILKER